MFLSQGRDKIYWPEERLWLTCRVLLRKTMQMFLRRRKKRSCLQKIAQKEKKKAMKRV